MEKYAKMSIDLIKRETGDVQLENEEDSKESSVRTSLSTRLSRVLNDSLSDATIREILAICKKDLTRNLTDMLSI